MSCAASIKSADTAVKSDDVKIISRPNAADNTCETVETGTEDDSEHQQTVNGSTADAVGWYNNNKLVGDWFARF